MQYQVPQFIEIEDKIFGPLTFKQFAYVAGGGGAGVLLFTFFPWWIAAPISLPIVALALALAFYKINGRPFVEAMEHAIIYYLNGKLYLWQQRQAKMTSATAQSQNAPALPMVPKISESKLKDLAWSLNIKDRQRLGVTSDTPSGFEI